MKVLVLNAGSSSQKSCLYELGEPLTDAPPEPLWEAHIDWTHQSGVVEIHVRSQSGSLREQLPSGSRPQVIGRMLETLWSGETQAVSHPHDIEVVGHRVVHGGEQYRESTRITPEVKAEIERLSVFAPLHNPASLEGIEAIEQVLHVPQVAVFDTAFHSNLPLAAAVYPGPYEWFTGGIRRYGFHGISHAFCARRTAAILGRDLDSLRLIICHLGNGCSLAAIRAGRSVDTTMGFTPLEGLMMGSRSGSVDPGLLLYLMRCGCSVDELEQVLNKSSGLLGISGRSSDMRQILAAIQAGDERAQLAFDLYIHRLRASIGSMLANLGGLDALVFTAGVGENSVAVRAATCAAFEFLGLKLDPLKNVGSPVDLDIATADSAIRVLVVRTQEDWAIARECLRLTQDQ